MFPVQEIKADFERLESQLVTANDVRSQASGQRELAMREASKADELETAAFAAEQHGRELAALLRDKLDRLIANMPAAALTFGLT